MRFSIEIECDNAAFGETPDDAAAEVARMLQEAIARGRFRTAFAEAVPRAPSYLPLFDVNGNRVGFIEARA